MVRKQECLADRAILDGYVAQPEKREKAWTPEVEALLLRLRKEILDSLTWAPLQARAGRRYCVRAVARKSVEKKLARRFFIARPRETVLSRNCRKR